jgi:putative membrane protein
MPMADPARPFVIELDAPPPSPAMAPPVPEPAAPVPALAAAMTRRRSVAGRVLAWAGGAFASVVLGVAAWDFLAGLLARWPLLGMVATALAGLALAALLVMAGREWAALMRLGRVDGLRQRALAARDLATARGVVADVGRLYAGREEMAEARRVMAVQGPEVLDGDALIRLAERSYLTSPDQAARRAVESAARKVATATALVPLALVDVAVALAANIAMVRQVAEIYGGRAGSFGSWRVLRRVFAHLAATGAIAVGDDLIGSVAGGGVLAKLSRRFGEGLVNGALTARVGVAAMEVCRPLPFDALPAPKVTNLVGRALAGFLPAGKPD